MTLIKISAALRRRFLFVRDFGRSGNENENVVKLYKDVFNIKINFDPTNNVYCFTAPWNIVFIPKIIDPFTGHEAKGNYVDEFKTLFKNKIIGKFKNEIVEYNNIMETIYQKIKTWVENNIIEKKKVI